MAALERQLQSFELAMPATAFVRGPRSPAPPGSYSGVGWPSSGAHVLAASHKDRSVRLIMMQEKREMLNIAAILTVSMSSRCRQLISAIIIATVSTSGAAARRGCPQRARAMLRTVSEIRARIGRCSSSRRTPRLPLTKQAPHRNVHRKCQENRRGDTDSRPARRQASPAHALE